MINKGIIHLGDLKIKKNKQSENFYFELEKHFKRELFRDALSITKTIINLAKEINIKGHNLEDVKTRKVVSLSTLKKLSEFLVKKGFERYSLENIEKKILYMKGGFTQDKVFIKFPINFLCQEGMRFIAHLYHDGGIGKDNRQPRFTNKIKEEVEKFLDDSKKLFGKFNRKVKRDKNKNKFGTVTYTAELPTVIGDIMISIGYVAGDKTKNNPPVLNFLKNLRDTSLIAIYIATAVNDDGHIDNGVRIQQSSLIQNNKERPSNVLILDKLMFEKLGIRVSGPRITKRYKNRYGICTNFIIGFFNKKGLIKFYKFTKNRLVLYKRLKLEKII